MESRAKLFGHPIHPMLIPFPLGLLSTSVIFDGIALLRPNKPWSQIAFWNTAAGVVGDLAAAVFGLIDWLAIPSGTRAKKIGLWHGVGNVVVVALFSTSWLLRLQEPRRPGAIPLVLAVLGVGLAGVTGWLGGELVDRLGVGVQTSPYDAGSPDPLVKDRPVYSTPCQGLRSTIRCGGQTDGEDARAGCRGVAPGGGVHRGRDHRARRDGHRHDRLLPGLRPRHLARA